MHWILAVLIFCLGKISKSNNKNDITFFPVSELQQLMVIHVNKTLKAWILFCKTWMAAENCHHKILIKAKPITSSSLITFSAKIRKTPVNLYWKF